MPSPLTAPSTDQAQSLDASAQSPQGASPLQNGVHGEGAVQQPDAPARVDGLDENNAIREGKQKAKAVLAASGVLNPDPSASEGPKPPTSMASPAPAEAVNGTAPSRKRSRSGSRKPSQTPGQDASKLDQDDYQKYLLHRYIDRDQVATLALHDQNNTAVDIQNQMNADYELYKETYGTWRHQDPGSVFGYGYMGYGNGITDMKGSKLQYPIHAKRAGNRRAPPLPRIPRDKAAQQADQIEELVPLRLDIEFDNIKLRDTFTWNLHDQVTPTGVFAAMLVEDFQLPPELRIPLTQQIDREIQEQLQDFYPHAFMDDEPLDPHLPYSAYKNDEMRILVKLNITIGQHTLMDQFEWELNNPLNSPEEFARQMAADLSLSGEFITAIAHSIREQCQMFTKSLYITGHPFDGRPVEDADVKDNFLPSPLSSVFRPMQSAKDYTPCLYELSEMELERAELSIMREQRRQKRSVNRRGGPALPDLKDRQRTVRSLIVSSVLPGAAESLEDSHIYKISRSKKTSGRPGRADDDTSESDSDESVPESPAPSQLTGGTARTRGMRGAATAAQAAMRSALGRSATPEVTSLQHEVRASSRALRYEAREESVSEATTLIIKLKINPKRFREYLQDPKAYLAKINPNHVPNTLSLTRNTPGSSSMPPPPSPAIPPRSTPTAVTSVETAPRVSSTSTPVPPPSTQRDWHYSSDGRADAPFPLVAGTTPAPPPPWLQKACTDLRAKYPNDLFEATMRYSIIDTTTKQAVKTDQLPTGGNLPPTYKAQYVPRIRCNDCPGKLYTAGPGLSVENFEVHLVNRQHRANVERRTTRTGS